VFSYCCLSALLLHEWSQLVEHLQFLQILESEVVAQLFGLELPERALHVFEVGLDVVEEFLGSFESDGLLLVLHLVHEHAGFALVLDFTLAAHAGAHADRPGFVCIELVAHALLQLVRLEPQRLFVVHVPAAQALSTQIVDGQHGGGCAVVHALETLDYFEHGLGHFIGAHLVANQLDSSLYCLA